jgi:aspartyl-tRNA(Asn)/glutamyl-tRNA(Gln) amidotransferase subunit A
VARTLTESARAVRDREVTPSQLVEAALERADRWQASTNAFTQIRSEDALQEARARTADVEGGKPLGPLHGVPVAVKDLFDVAGWETSGSSLSHRGQIARADAELVTRLRGAGAVIIGKTNQHELAAGGTNAVSMHGPTRNPWDHTRITGGSSGGSAAVVAARVVPMALGTDTGGSIRIPASFCGVAGLKPSYGLLPSTGMMPLAPSLDTAGPIAVSVEDLALSLSALAGTDVMPAADVAGLRIGVAGGFFARRTRPEVLSAVEHAGRVLAEAGAEVMPVDVPGLDDAPEAWSVLAMSEFAAEYGRLLRRPETLYPLTRTSMSWGASRTAVEYLHAREKAAEVRHRFLDVLVDVDVILAPATMLVAPPLGVEEVELAGERMGVHSGAAGWLTRPASLSGLPALSLPVGFSPEGLPLGAQVVARDREEAVLLTVGMAYQARTEHHLREPAPRAARTG